MCLRAKGRVEAGVKYVKQSFVPLREFRDLSDDNRQLRAWILGEAGQRVHGSTHERPLARFEQTERHLFLLQRLPDRAPELAVWAKVKAHGNAHVQFEKCQYTVPFPARAPTPVAEGHRDDHADLATTNSSRPTPDCGEPAVGIPSTTICRPRRWPMSCGTRTGV